MRDKRKKCPICDGTFHTLRSLHLHCVQNHAKEFICCSICFQPFKEHDELVEHSNTHHDRQTNAGIKSSGFKPIFRYEFSDQMITGLTCMACSKSFSSEGNTRTHYKETHLTIKYLCRRCPQSYASLQALKQHYRRKHASNSTTDTNVRLETPRKFAGFNVNQMEEAKTMYLKRIKLQNKGVPEELRMEANNEIGSNSSGQINKWQIEIYDESYATNEICTQALTYCNENGDMKLFSHEMNDLETSKETVDLTWSDKDTN